jgi:hypothetical protein
MGAAEVMMIVSTVLALGAAGGAIVLAIKWASSERALARTKAELQVARTDQAGAVAARAQERDERVLERQRAEEQIQALVGDLQHAHDELAKIATPAAAADLLGDSLQRAREILGTHAAARGGPARVPGNGSGAAGPAA